MKRVLTAAILIPIVVVALFRAPLWLFTLLVLGVAVLAASEYFGVAKAQGFRPFQAIAYFFLVCEFALLGYAGLEAAMSAGAALVFCCLILLVCGLSRSSLAQALPDSAVTFLVIPYVGMTLGCLVCIRSYEDAGALFLLFLMLLVWCGDIAAYYVGRAIGKHKLAPRISPGKTWEGAIASVVGAVIVGVLLFRYIDPIANAFRSVHLLKSPPVWGNGRGPFAIAPMWLVAVFAICVNVAAQVGDLVESALKRGAGVKDSGTLLPGHGGVLDRIDALLFALPVGLLFYMIAMSKYFEPRGPVT